MTTDTFSAIVVVRSVSGSLSSCNCKSKFNVVEHLHQALATLGMQYLKILPLLLMLLVVFGKAFISQDLFV